MTRLLLHVVTGLSLALCVAAAVLWVRSWRVNDWIVHRRVHERADGRDGATDVMFSTGHGVAHVGVWVFKWDYERFSLGWPPGREDGLRWEVEPVPSAGSHPMYTTRLGFGFHRFDPTRQDNTWTRSVTFPMWLLVSGFGVVPAVRGYGFVPRRRAWGPGKCRRCGYDLRATPGRCPECGEGVGDGGRPMSRGGVG